MQPDKVPQGTFHPQIRMYRYRDEQSLFIPTVLTFYQCLLIRMLRRPFHVMELLATWSSGPGPCSSIGGTKIIHAQYHITEHRNWWCYLHLFLSTTLQRLLAVQVRCWDWTLCIMFFLVFADAAVKQLQCPEEWLWIMATVQILIHISLNCSKLMVNSAPKLTVNLITPRKISQNLRSTYDKQI